MTVINGDKADGGGGRLSAKIDKSCK